MDLEFTINNQILKRTDSNKLVDWSDNYLRLCFGFETDDWNELTKFALFKHNGETVRLPLVDDAVTLPDELLTGDRLVFSLYGVTGDDFRITTNQVKLWFSRSGFTTDTSDIDELPTVITVLDEIYFAINSKVSQTEYNQRLAEYYTKTVIDDLLDKIDNKLTLKTDKTIIESGDTLNLTTQLKTNGFPTENVTVTFYEVINYDL